MAKWQTTLDLSDVYHAGKPIPELAGIVAQRLKALLLPGLTDAFEFEMRDELVADLESLAEDKTSNADDFDEIMSELYRWADTPLDDQWNGKKLCWVNTMERGVTA